MKEEYPYLHFYLSEDGKINAWIKEEGTAGDLMENQVEESIKIERRNQIMDIQQRVSYQLNKNHIADLSAISILRRC